MMETFRTCCFYGCLWQTECGEFHTDRLSCTKNLVQCPGNTKKSKIRVSKPRIGGGFGAKQSVVAEVFLLFVTWKTGKPSMIIYSRQESQTASSPRHEMEVTVRLGAMKNGKIRAIDVYTLSNSGAYGEHI